MTALSKASSHRWWLEAVFLVLVAGCSCSCSSTKGEVERGPEVGTWTPISAGQVGGLAEWEAAAWNGRELFVWGGGGASGARYSLDRDQWTLANPSGAPVHIESGVVFSRIAVSLVWLDDRRVFLWGGHGCNRASCRDGAIYDTQSETWSAVESSSAPRGRYKHSTVWTGSKMIVWGGVETDAFGKYETLRDGAVYDPERNAWSPMAINGAPEARSSHTVVWTGTKMIIWGGEEQQTSGPPIEFASGGVYDPSTDTWKPTALDGAPASRTLHSAVWTGSEMIIWGGSRFVVGEEQARTLDDGAAYDPVLDRWRPIGSGGLSARSTHSAVWTGNRMVIWGGIDGGGTPLNDGAILNVAEGRWQSVTTNGAPGPRGRHWAFWAGSRMLVWGGGTPESFVGSGNNDGAVFQP